MRLALVLVFSLVTSLVSAQADLLVLSMPYPPDAHHLRTWMRALRPRLHDAHIRMFQDSDCWPGEEACAARFTRSAHARRILMVRILREHAGCAPIADATGAVTGSRYLVQPMIDLTLLDAHGLTIAHQSRPAEIADAERASAAADLIHALGL